ncbi:MAG: KilA-N domain-containing protein [Methylovulum sp.]|nr:KilA-N domain-containing protein [Methylovulum sp.]
MTTQIITIEYNNKPVFFQSDAFINAAAIAGKFNKLPKDYLKTSRTKEYIDAVRRIFLTEENQLVKVVQGGTPEEQGTWLHPKLAIDFG